MRTAPRWKFRDIAFVVFALLTPTCRTGVVSNDQSYSADSRITFQLRQCGFLSRFHYSNPFADLVMPFGALRCPSVPFGALRCPSVPFGALRCPSVPFGALRCPSVPFGALRCPSVPFGALRCPSVPFGALRCPSVPFGALRCPSVPFGHNLTVID